MAGQKNYSPSYIPLLKLRAVSENSENRPNDLQDRLRNQIQSSITIESGGISIITSPSDTITKTDKQSINKERLLSSVQRSKTSPCLDIGAKPTEESACMLHKSTLTHSTNIYMNCVHRIRAFSKLRHNFIHNKSDIGDCYVVDSHENGPVCMLHDSPLRIFKCAQNGNAKEVARIIESDPTRLMARNPQGQTPLHVAVSKGHLSVVQVIVGERIDLDAVDSQGNTALHLAVMAESPDIVELLLKKGANSMIQNNCQMMPVHLAAETNNLDVMEALLDNGVDPNLTGESGATVLHYAVPKDNGDMIRLILAKGGKPCEKCDYGYYPIHIAARSASANAMEALIEQALKIGYTRDEILNFRDRENNLPLHSAVNGGNLKVSVSSLLHEVHNSYNPSMISYSQAVSVCLKAGASVKALQEDGSTPLHFACSQGNMDMIKLMNEAQPENFLNAVHAQDSMKMTPLHRAALFNHNSVIEYLLSMHADIDVKDIHDRTPLLLAASKGCWATVQLLVAKGADVHVKDKHNRNFLHIAIKFGGKLKSIADPSSEGIQHLLNERDDFGCTPLHYASKEGHLYALDDLINMGAVLNMKDNHKQSPFHFAARYGRVHTCRRLLDSIQGPNLINETDSFGQTALHIAAQNGHTKIIQLLLERGAVVSKDNEDSTALHHAASQGWTHSMKILLGVHQNLRDVPNIEGDTSLHVAAKNGKVTAVCLLLTLGATILKNKDGAAFFDCVIHMKHADVAVAVVNHDRWEEVLLYPSATYGAYILGLIRHLPAVCLNLLDRCQVSSSHDPRSSKFHITYNFKFLDPYSTCVPINKDNTADEEICPMMSLYAMVKNNRVECLSHPVCTTFLEGKWRCYGMWVYTAYLVVYIVFLASLTSFVVSYNSLQHYDPDVNTNKTADFLHGNHKEHHLETVFVLCLWFIAVYSGANMIKELTQIISQRVRYFLDTTNGLEWALYTTSLLFVVPFLFNVSHHWQWESGAIAVFLAWFNCLVFLQRFDFFGIYVVMFLEILRTLLQVLSVFSILIIAFGLSFYILLCKEESMAHSTPALSLLRTFMMMLELDYLGSFNQQYVDGRPETLHFDNLTLVFLVVFVLLMPILLMNLLIGLAVGDIESVQRDARLKRLAMQVELHINMERKMPEFLRKRVHLAGFTCFPNRCKSILNSMFSMITKTEPDSDGHHYSESQPSFISQEMYKQKVRMRDMSAVLEKNHQLLRKIMEKMEIHTEEDAWDEGCDPNSEDGESGSRQFLAGHNKTEHLIKKSVIDLWKGAKK